eukprot:3782746-Pyramimonas_sp.AAC.1
MEPTAKRAKRSPAQRLGGAVGDTVNRAGKAVKSVFGKMANVLYSPRKTRAASARDASGVGGETASLKNNDGENVVSIGFQEFAVHPTSYTCTKCDWSV